MRSFLYAAMMFWGLIIIPFTALGAEPSFYGNESYQIPLPLQFGMTRDEAVRVVNQASKICEPIKPSGYDNSITTATKCKAKNGKEDDVELFFHHNKLVSIGITSDSFIKQPVENLDKEAKDKAIKLASAMSTAATAHYGTPKRENKDAGLYLYEIGTYQFIIFVKSDAYSHDVRRAFFDTTLHEPMNAARKAVVEGLKTLHPSVIQNKLETKTSTGKHFYSNWSVTIYVSKPFDNDEETYEFAQKCQQLMKGIIKEKNIDHYGRLEIYPYVIEQAPSGEKLATSYGFFEYRPDKYLLTWKKGGDWLVHPDHSTPFSQKNNIQPKQLVR